MGIGWIGSIGAADFIGNGDLPDLPPGEAFLAWDADDGQALYLTWDDQNGAETFMTWDA